MGIFSFAAGLFRSAAGAASAGLREAAFINTSVARVRGGGAGDGAVADGYSG
jgi:hypothetical protein